MNIDNLRSPYDQVSGMVYFGRMLDKIRLHEAGALSADYVENLGKAFDGRCCQYLRVSYTALKEKTLSIPKLSDEELLQWCLQTGRALDQGDLEIWNDFMTKRGWRDDVHERLLFRLKEAGMPDDGSIETMFDYIDRDEGRTAQG